MKGVIVFLVLVLLQCQSPMIERTSNLDDQLLNKINNQLSSQAVIDKELIDKITISCQSKAKELHRPLNLEEYLTILRNEHFISLPQEIQQQKQALDNMAQLLEQDTVSQWLETDPNLSLPLPNVHGSMWINIDKNAIMESRKQGQITLQVLKEEQLVNEQEYETITKAVEKSSALFPYQLFDIMLKGLNK
jgi:hypothetical protein